ncbi:MAG: hypothetical protein HOY44_04550 [Maritimibacter sp.]|uniref:DODA-type extradiol aromatic ring-opening family dioxygenase n=1 Tax=Maritimibacter sp. TaxID=2003363 RepID=UPI001D239CB4|nr:hypothetical protein [Maritimibacter sp.]MBL6426776.1 hypothetical protein [Maritimibacter sp.]
MSEIVWSAAMAHTAAMMRLPEDTDPSQAERVFGAFDRLSRTLKSSGAEVLVMVGTDHMMTFSYETVPAFAIGTGEAFPSWGEAGTEKTSYEAVEGLGEDVVARLLERDFDVAGVAEMRLDHAFNCPLNFLFKHVRLPVLPVYVNCTIPPLPRHQRCLAFGEALGAVLREQGLAGKVGVVGTGGLSHWIGLPQTGLINEEFDRDFLAGLEAGDFAGLAALDSDTVIESAGNGAGEIRNWLVAAAASGKSRSHTLTYEPVSAWKTGIGAVEFT